MRIVRDYRTGESLSASDLNLTMRSEIRIGRGIEYDDPADDTGIYDYASTRQDQESDNDSK